MNFDFFICSLLCTGTDIDTMRKYAFYVIQRSFGAIWGHLRTLEGAGELKWIRTRHDAILYLGLKQIGTPSFRRQFGNSKNEKREPKDRDLGNITGFVRYFFYLWNSIIDQLRSRLDIRSDLGLKIHQNKNTGTAYKFKVNLTRLFGLDDDVIYNDVIVT